ncbi:MAG: DUF72 domain-containing protein [Gammaproteobacteria bacterium]|nr:DUF72 domain-containing protein [Gammaproteobacteria bacterium]NIR28445.1 DUF72 domain-containing protein [Gammaproteobacteria bacterium]NIR96891.1 DUF72 domain-containing protein [Gammaproteobacteria bacterium]NIT62592.1 DUF72 domain-containing protein [Gammaproteobacteria bacterium]NIV19549.1 DUF72 domain-containing protein [Gammaproteobacteria bacterium]
MARLSKRLHIGTSGWSYGHWKGPFYPEHLPNERMLEYYAEHFHCAEINNSFYHLPERHILEHWRDTVPKDFLFAAKASRYITHMKKLKDAHRTLPPFLDRMQILADKLGPILFQLPPRWSVNLERLNDFLDQLTDEFRYTMEFRDPSWFCPEVYDALAMHKVAFCIYDLDRTISPKEATADFVYVRLHGPDGPYQGRYTRRTLAGWAGAFNTWIGGHKHVYCFFDNDDSGYAAINAAELQDMLTKG